MRIIDCVQGTPEWFEARRGIPSASNFSRILTPKTLKPAAAAEDYVHELVAESIRLDPPYFTERPQSRAMQHGTDCEPEARRWLEMDLNLEVRQVGFCVTDDGRFGCSPDGLIGDDSGVEIKCPQPKTHVSYLLNGVLPDEYRLQVAGAMLVTGRKSWLFVSYCAGFAPFKVVVTPDETTVKLAEALEQFWSRYAAAKRAVLAML